MDKKADTNFEVFGPEDPLADPFRDDGDFELDGPDDPLADPYAHLLAEEAAARSAEDEARWDHELYLEHVMDQAEDQTLH